MSAENRRQIIEKFALHPTDTGSSDVQISLLTQRINQLTEHFKTHEKDFHSRRGLLKLVARRRGLIKYLQRTNRERYRKLITELNLRK